MASYGRQPATFLEKPPNHPTSHHMCELKKSSYITKTSLKINYGDADNAPHRGQMGSHEAE